MAGTSWEHASEARAALSAIVSDPAMGVSALSSAQMMSNLLKDLLPDAPREKSILVAAAEAGLADTMREHVAQGMDAATAVRLAASSFASSTPFTPEACSWVADELAIAIGISEPAAAGGPLYGAAPLAPGQSDPHALPTQIAPPGAGFAAGPVAQPAQPAQAPQPARAAQPTQAAQSNEQPTVQGYRPPPGQGYQQPQPGFGQAPGQGYQQPQPGFGQAPGQGYQQAPAQGYQKAPGFAQPPQAGGWQQGPQQYGPGAGYAPGGPGAPGVGYGPGGPPRRPGGARRVLLIVGGAVVGVVVLLIVIGVAVSGGHPKPSPTHHPPGTHTTPPTTPTSGPPALAAGTTPLRTIMKPAFHSAVGNNCYSRSNTNTQNLNTATVVDAAYCPTSFDANIKVWGYQFDSYAHYQTGLSNLNSYAGFNDPGTLNTICPSGSDPKGRTKWWAITNPNYQTHRPDQVLECFTDHIKSVGARALIIWTLPTQDVIFVGEDTVGNSAADFHYLVDVWWKHVAYA